MKIETAQPKRSDEPIWWALFSAGGVCFAVVLPGAILALAILPALGLTTGDSLSYARMADMVYHSLWGLAGLAFVAAAICLPLFHAAHRIHHGLHDLQLGGGLASKLLCYGLAALTSATGVWLLVKAWVS
ncbi:fumarate reductase [Arsukibacterium ikkense]|uniref:Fumarate reductase n=1 Tax=Arsukibacterium ikkense TaxID=336831 RepID=A0A0M2V0S9_9GAMM|nr:fumarate reductase subunit FrdD [Arsukibacterium ikkense]KKO44477.1 fumarate reductase [Arsukibacterium ikkense]